MGIYDSFHSHLQTVTGQHGKGEGQKGDIKNVELYEFGTFLISLTTDELKYHSFFVNVKITQKHINYGPYCILDSVKSNVIFCLFVF